VDNLNKFLLSQRLQVLVQRSIKLPSVAGLVNWVILAIVLVDVYLLIEGLEHHPEFLVIELSYIQSLSSLLLSTRKCLKKTFLLDGRKFDLIFPE
jgi:hypothetical protein